jgi:hypothetical protein
MRRQGYLDRARECREVAATMNGENGQRLLQLAEAWSRLAEKKSQMLIQKAR